jgi:hypothetical protein
MATATRAGYPLEESLFAANVASLAAMTLLTAIMVHEKTCALGACGVPVRGVALLAAASVVLLWSAYGARALG